MKKTLAWILVLAMTLSMIVGTTVAVAEDKTVIRILHFMGEESKRNGLQEWCDSYSATHPEVEFEIEGVAYAQYGQMVQTRIAADDMPDIITGRPRDWREFVENGHIADLSDLDAINYISEEFKNEMSMDGVVYGLPVDIAIKGVFYNKDTFAQMGIEIPTTYTEWVAVMDKCAEGGKAPFARPFKDTNAPETDFKASFNPTLVNTDPEMWVKIDKGEAKIADFPVFREELEKFVKRMSYPALDDYGNDPARALQLFAAGEAPLMINGVWIAGDLYANNPDANFGVFPLPWSEDPALNQFETKTDDVFMASAASPNLDIVKDFLNFVGSNEGGQIWMDKAGLLPANVNIELGDNATSLLHDIDAQMKDGKACYVWEVLELTGEPKNIYRNGIHALVGDDEMKADLDKFIAQMDEEIQTAMMK